MLKVQSLVREKKLDGLPETDFVEDDANINSINTQYIYQVAEEVEIDENCSDTKIIQHKELWILVFKVQRSQSENGKILQNNYTVESNSRRFLYSDRYC